MRAGWVSVVRGDADALPCDTRTPRMRAFVYALALPLPDSSCGS